MIETVEELRKLFSQYAAASGDPRAEELAYKHVEMVSELFEDWSDDELGYLLTDLIQILRLQRGRSDIIARVLEMVAQHILSNVLVKMTHEQLRNQN